MSLTQAQLGYVAGLFDGEGSVILTRRKTKSIHGWNYYGAISIANSNLESLKLCQEVAGGSICKANGSVNYQVYNLYMGNVIADNFSVAIKPYSIIKKQELEVFQSFRSKQDTLGKLARAAARWDEPKYLNLLKNSEENFNKHKQMILDARNRTRLCL